MTPLFGSSGTDWLDGPEGEASLMHDELQPHALSLRAPITEFSSSLVVRIDVTSEMNCNLIGIY